MDYCSLDFNKNDLLNRKTFVKNIMGVINEWDNFKHENDSLVMSVDAPWGSGKSYLLNMWKNWLISDENAEMKYDVVYYNAWEKDDCDNPFIPLVCEFQQINKNSHFVENTELKSKEFLKSCGIALLKDGIKKIIGENTADIINDGIDDTVNKSTKGFFEKYKMYIEEKEKFKKALKKLVPKGGKLIVFVDELDRCRPTFAVETLEIVKHYFDINDIVFIFAVDLEQLSYSIATMYGSGMDSAGYLRRFFDFNINIPTGDIKQYVKDKLEKMVFLKDFSDTAVNIYEKLGLSLRDIDKITNNFLIFCLFYKNIIDERVSKKIEIRDVLEVYLYFMTLKYKYPNIYNMIIKQEFISYDNSPKNWNALEMKYFVSPNISRLLKEIQTGRAKNIIDGSSLIMKYGMAEVNSDGVSFAEHIERTIEMFD